MTSKIDCTTTGARPSDGSSSSSSRGAPISARPMASICCWPPQSVPAIWPRRSRGAGRSRRPSPARPAARRGRAPRRRPARGSRGRSSCRRAAALRAPGRRPARRCGAPALPLERRAVETMLPARGQCRPAIVRMSVVLPAPFGPISATISPACDLQGDAPERLQVAVGDVEVVTGEHGVAAAAAGGRPPGGAVGSSVAKEIAAPEVRFDHPRIVGHVRRRTLGDLRPAFSTTTRSEMPNTALHEVLDHDDGHARVADSGESARGARRPRRGSGRPSARRAAAAAGAWPGRGPARGACGRPGSGYAAGASARRPSPTCASSPSASAAARRRLWLAGARP